MEFQATSTFHKYVLGTCGGAAWGRKLGPAYVSFTTKEDDPRSLECRNKRTESVDHDHVWSKLHVNCTQMKLSTRLPIRGGGEIEGCCTGLSIESFRHSSSSPTVETSCEHWPTFR